MMMQHLRSSCGGQPKATMLAAVFWALAITLVHAAPNQIDYQGKLADADGNPINDTVSITFRIWSASTGGSVLWTEVKPSVTVTDGLFHVTLGSITTIPSTMFDSNYRFLSVQIEDDPQMTPRTRFNSVAYAMQADSAAHATTAGSDNDWAINGANVYRGSGNVGIGTSSPGEMLHLRKTSGNARAKIESTNGDADLILDGVGPTPAVVFRKSGTYKASVGWSTNEYVFIHQDPGGNVVFKDGNVGIGTKDPWAALEVHGVTKLGPLGHYFGEVRALSGRTSASSGTTTVSLPSGYTDFNTRILCCELHESVNFRWVPSGWDTGEDWFFRHELRSSSIRLEHPNNGNFRNKEYRILIMKMVFRG